MAFKPSLLIAFFLLISTSFARHQQKQQQNQCQFRNIEVLEPYDVIQAEAGVTEFWDADNQQFQCAGVDFIRHRIQRDGLLLPSYVNTPILALIVSGNGLLGVILPGCPETYQYSPEQSSGQNRQNFSDRHQKVERLSKGDFVGVPTGAAHWIYNDGDNELVVVVFFHPKNEDNQLDQRGATFFLAGNFQGQTQQPPHGQNQGQRQDQPQLGDISNIFAGAKDAVALAEFFNVEVELALMLQGQNDQRGQIVDATIDLQLVQQQQHQTEQQQPKRVGGPTNEIEKTICSLNLSVNIDNPNLHADFVNPKAGWITNINTFKFPILGLLKLSAEKGELYKNAFQSPYWTLNAHNLVYITDGTMRIQIVNNEGNSVFDNELREGQVVVIPQNFAVVKRAGDHGCKWVSFKTNDNAMISTIAGPMSVFTSMPVDVVANAYRISREDANRVKFSQNETVMLSPRGDKRLHFK